MGKEEIIRRWTEYIGNNNKEGPPILEAEVRDAINQMKKGKATGPDNVTVEELEVLGDFGIEVITKLLNDVYNSGYIPENLLQSVFITVPKKSGFIDCEL